MAESTEDLGPVILMSDDSQDHTDDANDEHCNDNVVAIIRATQ